MKFHVGQRVRTVNCGPVRGYCEATANTVGRVATVTSCPGLNRYDYSIRADSESHDWEAIEEALEPLRETDSFENFMERVLKPVDLGQPVSA